MSEEARSAVEQTLKRMQDCGTVTAEQSVRVIKRLEELEPVYGWQFAHAVFEEVHHKP